MSDEQSDRIEALKGMREEFPKEQILSLPRITCGACSKDRNRVCDRHRKIECRKCGNRITSAHIDLDYVGHAELTDRLLKVDPLWSWEPMGTDERGLPAFDQFGGLWIRLTVCGHTRPGYGDAQGKTGPNAVKEAIGDALRNAAMRFGAALDLWAKSDLAAAQTEHPKTDEDDRPSPEGSWRDDPRREEVAARNAWNEARDALMAVGRRKGLDEKGVAAWCLQQYGGDINQANANNLIDAAKHMEASRPDIDPGPAYSPTPSGGVDDHGYQAYQPPCTHPKGFTEYDDGNGHSGSFCELCDAPKPSQGIPPQRTND